MSVTAPSATRNLPGKTWLQPLDDGHWSERLSLVPTKASFSRQQHFVEEQKGKFQTKKIAFASMQNSCS